jgi:hypothetical protein
MLRRASYVLYVAFNSACTIVFAYQGYLWVRGGGWTKIPTHLLLPGYVLVWPVFAERNGAGRLFRWCCNVELAYTLCVIAMMFYGIKWLLERRDRQRQGCFPALSGEGIAKGE